MTGTLLPGITARSIPTSRYTANVLERAADAAAGPDASTTIVFVHGNVSSSLFWQPLMLSLPEGVRALAIDLRGFGTARPSRSTPPAGWAISPRMSPRCSTSSAPEPRTSSAGAWAAAW